MLINAFAFLSGIGLATFKTDLTPTTIECVIALLIFALAVFLWFLAHKKSAIILLFLLGGFIWMIVYSHISLQQTVIDKYLNTPLLVEGSVVDLPKKTAGRHQFLFLVEKPFQAKIRLSWYQSSQKSTTPVSMTPVSTTPVSATPVSPTPGQALRLLVKLKRNSGWQNPTGFDYERWLFAQKINATGYVVKSEKNTAIGWRYNLSYWRGQLKARLLETMESLPYRGILLALAMGDRNEIDNMHWQTLIASNTSHLTVVSGLHIGLIATFVFFLAQRLWRFSSRCCLFMPARVFASYLAIMAAFCYALLSGFSVPTQRAFVMVLMFFGYFILRRHHHFWQLYAFALLAVLLLNPLSVLTVGFWLSFVAVFMILYSLHLSVGKAWYWRLLLMQFIIFVGLLPWQLLFFQSFSWLSPLANIVAVPYVSFLVLPVVLLAVLLDFILWFDLSSYLWQFSDALVAYLFVFLETLMQFDWQPLTLVKPSNLWQMFCLIVAVFLLLAPAGLRIRRFGFILLLPLFLPAPNHLNNGQMRLILMDTGQSLAALVQTKKHHLLFDTGFASLSGFNIGDAVIAPLLKARNITAIDRVIISHSDNDHIGGLSALRKRFVIKDILTSNPEKITDSRLCYAGQKWHWDGVFFEILHPSRDSKLSGNNASCVLKITTKKHRLLLSADIEKKAEKQLLGNAKQLNADVLLVPHHGSLTSSSADFITAVSPSIALITSGYGNRFGFPKKTVVARYLRRGIAVFDTQCSGAITLNFKDKITIDQQRLTQRRYWLRQC